jgi:glycosyltransferase involved in cell wall biosynthesis
VKNRIAGNSGFILSEFINEMNTVSYSNADIADKPYFTVFTPVYNGEKHLSRVFESIKNQTFNNFEWIIIDDGSTDETKYLIENFISENPEIDVRFFSQGNSGKHIAWNKAVEISRGRLFIPADADDYFFPDTLEFFNKQWESLSSAAQKKLSGINVLCFDNDSQNIVGSLFPEDGMQTDNLQLQYKYKVKGEKWGCIRTDLLKSRRFPIIKNTHYPEDYLWLYFAKHFQLICFNKALRRYYTTETGIIQCLGKKTVNGAWVSLKYNTWFLKNFGLFLLVNSPKTIYHTFRCTASSMKIIFKSWMAGKSVRIPVLEKSVVQ